MGYNLKVANSEEKKRPQEWGNELPMFNVNGLNREKEMSAMVSALTHVLSSSDASSSTGPNRQTTQALAHGVSSFSPTHLGTFSFII